MKNKTAIPSAFPSPFGGPLATNTKVPIPKGKDFFSTITRLTYYLRNYMGPINDSKIFAGMMIIILNIGSKYVNMRLPKHIEGYLKYTFSRNIIVFAICWMGTRDILTAVLITFLFIIIMEFILNDESDYCCLPESFIDYHREAMTDAPSNVLDPSDNAIDMSRNFIMMEIPQHRHDDLFEDGSSGGTLGFSHYD